MNQIKKAASVILFAIIAIVGLRDTSFIVKQNDVLLSKNGQIERNLFINEKVEGNIEGEKVYIKTNDKLEGYVNANCLQAIQEEKPETKTEETTTQVRAARSAQTKLGKPYVWGGAGPNGYDCSGLTYSIYKKELGKNIPRTSKAQSKCGQPVAKQNLQKGDLIFFNTTGKGVSHVGIYIDNNTFIHAASGSRRVKTNKLNGRYYASRYVCARRVI